MSVTSVLSSSSFRGSVSLTEKETRGSLSQQHPRGRSVECEGRDALAGDGVRCLAAISHPTSPCPRSISVNPGYQSVIVLSSGTLSGEIAHPRTHGTHTEVSVEKLDRPRPPDTDCELPTVTD